MVSVPVIFVPDKLPPVILPVAETTPAVLMFAPVTLPLTLKYQETFAPVHVTITMLALPIALIVILPFAAIATLLLPSEIEVTPTTRDGYTPCCITDSRELEVWKTWKENKEVKKSC